MHDEGDIVKRIEDLTGQIKRAYRQFACVMPLERITVSLICKELDISRKAFYTRFESREMVLESILRDDMIAPIKAMYPALTRTISEQASMNIVNEQVFQAIADHGEFYMRLVALNEEKLVSHVLQKCYLEAQEYTRVVGGVPESEEFEYASRFLSAANAAMVIHWLRGGMKTPIPAMAQWFGTWSTPAVMSIAKK